MSKQDKKALRQQLSALRDAAAPEQRAIWSEAVCKHLLDMPAYQSARVVHCFVSIQSELDTRPIIEHALSHGKQVAIPLFVRHSDETPCCEITSLADDEYEIGGFGLRIPRQLRPVDAAAIDIVLAPLLAFAPTPTPTPALPLVRGRESERKAGREGRGWLRLGYGVGYYDRFLSRVRALKVGVAFEIQRVDQLPCEPHDMLLDAVITETGYYQAQPASG
jgi:5-formyltetrahydrofolate cyclo-ligase